ncbi:MAG: hypothetical protein ABEJ61_08065 [Haloferacaceae archaeon]
MVPDSERPGAGGRRSAPSPNTDGGTSPGFDEAALHDVVRRAVKDALLDVVGTLLLVGVGFVLVVAGLQAALGTTSRLGVVAGVGVAAVGVYVAAAALELVPPVRGRR